MTIKKIAIIMGSDSDYPVVKNAGTILTELGLPFITRVMSAHRTPELVEAFASGARDEGFGVIIAAAGKAAHPNNADTGGSHQTIFSLGRSWPSMNSIATKT